MAFDLDRYRTAARAVSPEVTYGRVVEAIGLAIESQGPRVGLGDLCWVDTEGGESVPAEVVGLRDGRVILMPLGKTGGITAGSAVRPAGQRFEVPVGDALIGRVVDAFGNPIDGLGPIGETEYSRTDREPPGPLQRPIIRDVLPTGVRVIDACTTLGEGQRIGIFAGAGVGKSVLLAMMARGSAADVVVIALVGERGREVQEFVARDLGEEGRRRSVVVVATSDEPALRRVRAAATALTVAEHFRDQGKRVLLLFDSLTRVATAQREVGLAAGEPPATRGFPPSAFAILPSILERAGTSPKGSITGFFTVLVEGDDLSEPISDAARSVLDGHLVLSRDLADSGIFPAVDIGRSVSRVMRQIVPQDHLQFAQDLRHDWSVYEESKDLVRIGAYQAGSSAEVDRALQMRPRILDFIRQGEYESITYDDAISRLREVAP